MQTQISISAHLIKDRAREMSDDRVIRNESSTEAISRGMPIPSQTDYENYDVCMLLSL